MPNQARQFSDFYSFILKTIIMSYKVIYLVHVN